MDYLLRSWRCRRGVLAALLALATAMAAPFVGVRTANADPYPNTYGHPDKGTYHTFCFTLSYAQYGGLVTRARSSMSNVEAQTVVDTQEQNCGSSTDVVINKAIINGRATGSAVCIQRNSNGYCDKYALTVDWEFIQDIATNPHFEARHTLCHEIGHTLGLNHYAQGNSPDGSRNSCMISGLWDSGAGWTKTYGPHHIGHINNWFA